MQQPNGSEVARLREQITREHEAANWALSGLADETTRHRFITRRMEQIGKHHDRLRLLIGERASTALMIHILEGPTPKRGTHE